MSDILQHYKGKLLYAAEELAICRNNITTIQDLLKVAWNGEAAEAVRQQMDISFVISGEIDDLLRWAMSYIAELQSVITE